MTSDRLPEFGTVDTTCRLFGIGRTVCFRLIREGRIRSVQLRHPGRVRGRRLVHLQSVKEFLFGMMNHDQAQQEHEAT